MKKYNFQTVLLLLLVIISVSSCRKRDSSENDWTSMQDQNSAEFNSDQIIKEVDEASSSTGLKKGTYPIVTFDTISSPKKMTIDYGTVNFLCEDGNLRRGKILVSWTGAYRQVGTVIQISFDSFYQNDNSIQGSKQVENLGLNADNQLVYSVSSSISITNTSNQTYSWTTQRTRKWIAGILTKNRFDDVYLISGQSNGTNRNGKSFSTRTISDLKVDNSCNWRVVSGTLEINLEGRETRTIDYGNGSCDATFTVTVGDRTYTVTRKK